jgi:hypothetical protein
MSEGAAERVRSAATRARATIARFREWLKGLEPVGCAAGPDFIDLVLRRGHWCRRSRRELATEAKASLEEALARLHERASQLAPGGWPEVQARLTAKHPAVVDYLAAYRRTWERCREWSDSRQLVTWPDYPIRYVEIPEETRDAAPFLYYLHYRSPAPFDELPVHDYVVAPIGAELDPAEQERRLRATNDSVITLNHVVHHGAIGHHIQNYYAYHGRSEIGRVAAVDCACRIGMFLGGTMAEGWACYATDLMDEQGFLTTDESAAQEHSRARLASRAVVDIGLHEGSLSFDDAVSVYRDRVGMSHEAARAEACKNAMFPGTALMYWLGTQGLHTLRREQAHKCASLRAFHDRVLSFGSIPVPLVSQVWS